MSFTFGAQKPGAQLSRTRRQPKLRTIAVDTLATETKRCNKVTRAAPMQVVLDTRGLAILQRLFREEEELGATHPEC